ncbi:MAG: SH3 domain-containing protein [Bacteroidota bacterium]
MQSNSILAILFSLFLISCGEADPTGGEDEPLSGSSDSDYSTLSGGVAEEEKLYTWVDRLNLRTAANTGSEVVTKLSSDTPLQPTGNQTDRQESIVLRGVLYTEPWLEVRTPDGQTGWVFGGAVKTEGEPKGNDPISDSKFAFPIFGDYDLSEWGNMGIDTDDEEGDFDRSTKYYSNGPMQLAIESYEGEYGYGYTYRLVRGNGQLLKQRTFRFTNVGDPKVMTEEVIDYTDDPAMRYVREQTVAMAYQRLNARPMMVNGYWESKPYNQ